MKVCPTPGSEMTKHCDGRKSELQRILLQRKRCSGREEALRSTHRYPLQTKSQLLPAFYPEFPSSPLFGCVSAISVSQLPPCSLALVFRCSVFLSSSFFLLFSTPMLLPAWFCFTRPLILLTCSSLNFGYFH